MVVLDENTRVAQFGSNADYVEDWELYDSNARKIGEIDAVLGDDLTTLSELAIGFDEADAFVDGEVVVAVDRFVWAPNRFSLNVDQAGDRQLEPWNH